MSRHNRDRRKKPTSPKYMPALVAAAVTARMLQPGTAYIVKILHDDWCDLLAGRGPCNCDPEVQAPMPCPRPDN